MTRGLTEMQPFKISIPQADLDDLHRRLARVRWPDARGNAGWARGVPSDYLVELVDYWRTEYDWRTAEVQLNKFPQFTTQIDGVNIHLIHARSPEPDALPLLMTHGWPGSVAEFLQVIEPLTNPSGNGKDSVPAFHVVVPSLPGFGFSGPTLQPGWNVERIARAWAELMHRLGYERYIAHGGDLGTWVTTTLAELDDAHVMAAHVTLLMTPPPSDPAASSGLSVSDRGRVSRLATWLGEQSGYMKIQATRPQTLAYGLTDSPVGQLAWIAEKFWEWTDSQDAPEDAVSREQMLTNVSIYWLTATAGSSAQVYYEMADQLPVGGTLPKPPPPLLAPIGVAVYPHDLQLPIRGWADPYYPNIVQWNEFDRGGHFAAMEEPDLFVADLRSFARTLRDRGLVDMPRRADRPISARESKEVRSGDIII